MECPRTAASPGTFGRKKENVSGDSTLRDTSMSALSLSAMSFELPASFLAAKETLKYLDVPDAVYASSSSSICTRESDAGTSSDVDSIAPNHKVLPGPLRLDRVISEQLNAKVSLRQTSRQGRSSQRWITESNETIRLVTGCVPVLKCGKIMFVSASRKPEWILPKGGWELDEAMEESAVRECFEEAGVFGVLGPKLKQVEYETRKAKKRRLELEEFERNCKAKIESDVSTQETKESADKSSETTEETSITNEAMERIREEAQAKASTVSGYQSEGKLSTSSSTYSKVRMTLYPLYVSHVMEKWPEDGRFRKAVEINEAIKLLDGRPELKEALEEVKRRGLHLMPNSFPPSSGSSPL